MAGIFLFFSYSYCSLELPNIFVKFLISFHKLSFILSRFVLVFCHQLFNFFLFCWPNLEFYGVLEKKNLYTHAILICFMYFLAFKFFDVKKNPYFFKNIMIFFFSSFFRLFVCKEKRKRKIN